MAPDQTIIIVHVQAGATLVPGMARLIWEDAMAAPIVLSRL
jgi:hypothetical protein